MFTKLVLASVTRHASSAVSGLLLAHGLASASDAAVFVNVGAAVLVWAGAQLWSLLKAHGKVKA